MQFWIRALGRRRGAALSALLVGFFILLGFVAFERARVMPQNSDTVQGFLAAQSMLSGNLLLKGWHLASDNFFFTDIIPLAGLRVLLRNSADVIWIYPASIFLMLVLACFVAAIDHERPLYNNLICIGVITLIVGLPPAGISNLALLWSNAHSATILVSLGALLLLADMLESEIRPLRVAVFVILTSAAAASDPFALVFAFGPALFVAFAFLMIGKITRKMIIVLTALLCSIIIGYYMPKLIALSGGFHVQSPLVSRKFVSSDHLWRTVVGVVFGIITQAGGNIFGRDVVSLDTIGSGVRLAVWVISAVAILRQFICRRAAMLDYFLGAGVIGLSLACALSGQFDWAVANPYEPEAAFRYLAPILVFWAILAARALPTCVAELPTNHLRAFARVAIIAAAAALLASHVVKQATLVATPSFVAASREAQVARWLTARQLTCGVGDYWASAIMTALSDGHVLVAPVAGPSNAPLRPYLWIADEHWYKVVKRPRFAIWPQENSANAEVNHDTISAAYGTPEAIEQVAGFTVAILSHAADCRGDTER